jgi:hypothetical protein
MGESHQPGTEPEGTQLSVVRIGETPGEPSAYSKRDAELGECRGKDNHDTDSGAGPVGLDSRVDHVGSAWGSYVPRVAYTQGRS